MFGVFIDEILYFTLCVFNILRVIDSIGYPFLRIIKKHKRAFNACTDQYIGKRNYKRLFDILKNPEDYSMSEVRKIIFSAFNALQEKNIIPTVAMGITHEAEKSRFFAGGKAFSPWKDPHNPKAKSKEEIMGFNYVLKENYKTPKPIAVIEKYLWTMSSDWSHDQEHEQENPDVCLTSFGKKGAANNLCELLAYIKNLIDRVPEGENAWRTIKITQKDRPGN